LADLATEKTKIEGLFNKKAFSVKDQGLAVYKQDFLKDLAEQ